MKTADESDVSGGPTLRDRILGAAFEAFMQLGFAGASTAEIARRARVSKRDLYAQFGSKQAMLSACIASRAERMRKPLSLPVPRSREALLATLTAFGRTLLLEAARPEVLAVHRLAIVEAEHAPEVAQTLDELGRGNNVGALQALLTQAQTDGLLGPGRPDVMAEVFLALLWSEAPLLRLLLGVVAAPDESARERRGREAAAETLRLFGVG